ncbi:hypothetical protein BC936DRAFT_140874 [Jimgerdemannia flammicorona]|uniref:Uncharacterized protein n=1 Tax=Jimgerdemannia flammicorona TaxID=994334 RepID=A0A433A387_9FUNG|nr:hypothetical protein BC936DRAFT_140874 [Jimgerdemannia flammicorona]
MKNFLLWANVTGKLCLQIQKLHVTWQISNRDCLHRGPLALYTLLQWRSPLSELSPPSSPCYECTPRPRQDLFRRLPTDEILTDKIETPLLMNSLCTLCRQRSSTSAVPLATQLISSDEESVVDVAVATPAAPTNSEQRRGERKPALTSADTLPGFEKCEDQVGFLWRFDFGAFSTSPSARIKNSTRDRGCDLKISPAFRELSSKVHADPELENVEYHSLSSDVLPRRPGFYRRASRLRHPRGFCHRVCLRHRREKGRVLS